MTCDRHAVVVVPFPFSDSPDAKRRPALVLSSAEFNRHGHTVMAMITTRSHHPWPGDHPIANLQAAGLPRPCTVRFKVFTIDNRLIIRRLGHLAPGDAEAVGTFADRFLC